MDNQRLLIWVTFGLLLWMTYQAWVTDHAPPPAAPTTTEVPLPAGETGLPALPADSVNSDAAAQTDQAPPLDAGATIQATAADDSAAPSIRVLTDVLDVAISAEGATIEGAVLRNYPLAKDRPDLLVELLSRNGANFGLVQSGLNAAGDGIKPDHRAIYSTPRNEYLLGNGNELEVPFTWTNGQGITVEKTLRFSRGSYRIDVTHRLVNDSGVDWRGAEYAQIQRHNQEPERSMFDVDSYSFAGPIIYDGEKSEKLDRDDLLSDGAYAIQAQEGWVGAIEHHFLSALVPSQDSQYNYNVSVNGAVSTASLIRSPAIIVPQGSEFTFETTAFVGPKLQAQLEEIQPSLKLTVDYGWLTLISQPLFCGC